MASSTNGAKAPSESDFKRRRFELLAARAAHVASWDPLNAAEAAFEKAVYRPLLAEAAIDPAQSFLTHKADYDGSAVLALLRRMPKGGVLHTHGIASGDFKVLVEKMQAAGRFFVWKGGDNELAGKVKSFAQSAVPDGWVPAESLPPEELYNSLTLQPGLGSVEVCWREFGNIWLRVQDMSCCVPFYFGRQGFLWHILEEQLRANVLYVEIKEPVFIQHVDYDGCVVPDDTWTDRFRDTVLAFQVEHPSFLGARMVLVSLKARTVEEVRDDFRRCVMIKERLPDFVAGFDLAGPEDVLTPIEAYAVMLEAESAAAASRGVDLPLMLHAGETNVPDAAQIFDAVALRCERIGHGFALARHPTLLKEVVEQGTLLECCPISNQVLGYVPNLANHAALGLLRAGVPMSISPDDPGMWHYSDVSYDFAAVAKAWDLGLAELKALARNSLAYSSLRGERREAALRAWQQSWDAWVDAEAGTGAAKAG